MAKNTFTFMTGVMAGAALHSMLTREQQEQLKLRVQRGFDQLLSYEPTVKAQLGKASQVVRKQVEHLQKVRLSGSK